MLMIFGAVCMTNSEEQNSTTVKSTVRQRVSIPRKQNGPGKEN